MSPRPPGATRERILHAATVEFATYGIAGARVDRIAKSAQTSKERVYSYFSSKEALYQHVAGEEMAAMADAIPLDASDLPGYAGRLHDHAIAHPDRHRIMQWGRLELSPRGATADDPVHRSLQHKIQQLRDAQAAGLLDDGWDAEDVLVFVTQLATSWAGSADAPGDDEDRPALLAARKTAIMRAVERLFPSATSSAG